MKSFFKAVLTLNTQKDAHDFFRDVATLSELQALAERWWVAQLLNKGLPYRKISDETGVSTTTVTRIAYWMENGQGGYTKALKRTGAPSSKKKAPRRRATHS